MKSFFTYILILGAIQAGAADEKSKPAPDAPRSNSQNEPSIEEVQTIRKVLELPPERLARLRSSIERIERMSPEERKDFATTLSKLENASPEERKKAIKDMRDKAGPVGLGAKVFEYHLKQLSPDEAKQERLNFVKLSSDERQQYIRKLLEKYSADLPKIRADGKPKDKDKDGEKDKEGEANREGDRPNHRRAPAGGERPDAPPAQ